MGAAPSRPHSTPQRLPGLCPVRVLPGRPLFPSHSAQALTRAAPASPPESPRSAACLSWHRCHKAGWAAASRGRSPSARPGTCGQQQGGRRPAHQCVRPGRGPQGGASPARVHRGKGEGYALEEQDHEEPLAGGAVTYTLPVLTRLGGWSGGQWGGRSGLGADPGILPPGWVGPASHCQRDWRDARAPAWSARLPSTQ